MCSIKVADPPPCNLLRRLRSITASLSYATTPMFFPRLRRPPQSHGAPLIPQSPKVTVTLQSPLKQPTKIPPTMPPKRAAPVEADIDVDELASLLSRMPTPPVMEDHKQFVASVEAIIDAYKQWKKTAKTVCCLSTCMQGSIFLAARAVYTSRERDACCLNLGWQLLLYVFEVHGRALCVDLGLGVPGLAVRDGHPQRLGTQSEGATRRGATRVGFTDSSGEAIRNRRSPYIL